MIRNTTHMHELIITGLVNLSPKFSNINFAKWVGKTMHGREGFGLVGPKSISIVSKLNCDDR